MKTIIASLLLVTWLASPASAQNKKTHHHNHKSGGSCPATTCTDHSYDQAYTAPDNNWKGEDEEVAAAKKNCPAATCTDHSYDHAYTAPGNNNTIRYSNNRTRRQVSNSESALPSDTWVRMKGNENSYSLTEYTYYGRGTTGINRPSAYEGDDAPTYDGAQKNAYRNIRANNDSERLPANNGK